MSIANKRIRAGIIGGAGYTGGETLRLLLRHPGVHVVFVQSNSNAGKPVYAVHQDLLGDTELVFAEAVSDHVDVLFLCLGHGEARKFLGKTELSESIRIIDLSQDFRHSDANIHGARTFVYGLPEVNRDAIETAKNIANPGCFATAIQLALLPLAKNGVLNDVHVSGITGSTGAGQQLQQTSHFSWRANNMQAYKSLAHQHVKEINETLTSFQPGFGELNFMPFRGDFPRGIYVSAYVKHSGSIDEAYAMYEDFYYTHEFTIVSKQMIDMKQAVNTNKCLLSLEKVGDKLVIHSAIDNLLKGAAGQAVQNMNLMFGLDEHAGLQLKSIAF